ADFFEEYTRVQAESSAAWEEAKNASDFSIYAPHLEKMIEMTKQMTKYREPEKDVYDALINQFEKGMDCETIDKVFGELKEELIPLVKQILAAEQPDDSKFNAYFDPDAQKKVQKLLLEYMGFTFERGSVGESEHPFTLNFSSKDVRVTNHYYENNALISMYSAIHEGGHAIFEQNVNPDFDGTIAGSCRYMGIHESQSRFYENILGRNKNFWVPIYAKIQELLPAYKEVSLDEFYQEINHVRNSFIRTDADEITYAFHIILRYEIEKEIFRNNVSVDQLPKLWNQKMEEYLGITPANDAEGILQDMHWSDGSFGYFPSYLLGSVYDGMFYEKMQEELGDVDEILAKGNIKDITKWLNEKIHQYGSTRAPKEVIEKVCGVEVSAKPLIRHFKKKYIEIYNL
ncbi:MAG: carboxypeptidase M32, partial [Agathobacter sp.]|nr:carboxypeptidase M32 [Agathobacter sp.]